MIAPIVLAVVVVCLIAALVTQADRHADALDRKDRVLGEMVDRVCLLLDDDRAERKNLLHLLTSRTLAEYASTERAVAKAEEAKDVRRPRLPQDYQAEADRILDAIENGDIREPGSTLPEGLR